MSSRISIRIAAIALVLGCCASKSAFAQASSFRELQAAYIFNFAKYVQWPQHEGSFVIGVVGNKETTKFLEDAFDEKKIGGRNVVIRWIEEMGEIADCNMVYVPESGTKHIRMLVTEVTGRNILIVSEEDLIRRGASISFVVENRRLRFKLKESAMIEAGLKPSQGLLKLAILQ